MKQEEVNRTIQTEGVIQKKEFGFKLTGKSYKTFISTLYKDKITAIIRELSANAVDAHRVANNTNPYTIHIPNTFEPYFSIRDYGISMDHDMIMTVYSTFFDSNKNDNNDDIGGLGLGAKTPLSYCDLYTVISYKGGVQNTYNVFYNERSIPEMNLMSVGETSEPDGIEVIFPVKKEDFSEFSRKSRSIFKYFSLKPVFTGQEITIESPSFIKQGNGWAIDDTNTSAKVVMGGVAYPISDLSQFNLTPAQKAIIESNIVMFFNIGDLEVAPSRESLSYDKATAQKLISKIDEVIEEIKVDFVNEINKCNSIIEARFKFVELIYNTYSSLKNVVKNIDIKLGDVSVTSDNIKLYEKPVDDVVIDESRFFIEKVTLSNYRENGRYTSNPILKFSEVFSMSVSELQKADFYLMDVKIRGLKGRLENVSGYNNSIYIIHNYDNKDENKKIFDEFFKVVGFDSSYTFKKLSDLKDIPEEKKVRPFYSKVAEWKGDDSFPCVSVDMNDTTTRRFYVPIHFKTIYRKNAAVYIDNEISSTILEKVVGVLEGMNLKQIDEPIYGVKASVFRTNGLTSNWINIFDFFVENVPDSNEFKKFVEDYVKYKSISSQLQDIAASYKVVKNKLSNLSPEHPITISKNKVAPFFDVDGEIIEPRFHNIQADSAFFIISELSGKTKESFVTNIPGVDIAEIFEFKDVIKDYEIISDLEGKYFNYTIESINNWEYHIYGCDIMKGRTHIIEKILPQLNNKEIVVENNGEVEILSRLVIDNQSELCNN